MKRAIENALIFWNQVEFINKARINIFMIKFSSPRTWNVFFYVYY